MTPAPELLRFASYLFEAAADACAAGDMGSTRVLVSAAAAISDHAGRALGEVPEPVPVFAPRTRLAPPRRARRSPRR